MFKPFSLYQYFFAVSMHAQFTLYSKKHPCFNRQ
nr:MAG TPA: hypothetical protein [Caudoviricetes sp.]DAZ59933.1 MAG TPA: hypothetical protein [Caudoviricetes sp.]DAZ83583.1 MAG TPA: hypothetical protein [Caudoviricetes sp.]